MKKYYVFLLTIALALGLSSFTQTSNPSVRYYYQSGGIWKHVDLAQSPCPIGPNVCQIFADGAFRNLYFDESTDQPVPKN